ncbi:hypothetical protein U9M48_033797 [Paspalum notatum var. saurae]|uniref:non-specific serine/threonine protein kinase n=1 Tax=Paspalum notatum var. saurae TaxID=547442 RepID=A0AAQ3U885_PASNO
MSSSGVTDVTFQMIERITNGFSEEQKVGSGGYGEVYKGVLNGEEIAVKKLFIVNGIDDKEFKNEFYNLMKVQHQNIVRLVGYCYEIKHKNIEHKGEFVLAQVIERALCFEYMQEGSLASHISVAELLSQGSVLDNFLSRWDLNNMYIMCFFACSDESCIHNWPTTYKIIKGTCEGLHYLHKGQKDYIYHLDLKPENILLDKNLVPKIADFGLSRLFGSSRTHVTSTARGTILSRCSCTVCLMLTIDVDRASSGFMPPEYIEHCIMTPKNDVFSLGVIIFQMMAGKQGYSNYCESSSSPQEFIKRVQEKWKKRMQATAGYTSQEIDVLVLGVKKCIEIAATCVEKNRDKRPSTIQIIDELNQVEAQIAEMLKNMLRDFGSKDIAVDPSLELRFPFELQRSISCCLQLTNKADGFVAFDIKADQTKYCARPSKGTLPPCSRCYVTVTLRAQEKGPPNMQCHDVLVVRGTRVSEGFTPDQITADLFHEKVSKEGTAAVDEVTLPIVFVEVDKSVYE